MSATTWAANARACPFLLVGLSLIFAFRSAALAEADKDASEPAWPQRWLSVDDRGWSVLKPSGDSRLIYVSNHGDDATASPYSPSAEEVGNDPFKPTRTVKSYKTLAAAVRQMRAEHADWLLLRRGDVWEESLGKLPNGRNGTEPAVVSAYGVRPERPVLKIGPRGGFDFDMKRGFHDVAVVSVEVYAHTKDPRHPEFGKAPAPGGGTAFF